MTVDPRAGILVVNKSSGMTSFKVVATIKRLLNIKKVGHAGTLDPLATGVLPICLGRATKLSSTIMSFEKEYDVWAEFGIATDSQDRTGEVVVEKDWQHIDQKMINDTLKDFVGDITQVPPMHSALKHQGKPLYWYAHRGISVEHNKLRHCHVRSLTLTEFAPPKARLLVNCSKGTYVRTLVNDLAVKLGSAAVVAELCRRAVGHFHVDNAVTLEELETLDIEQRWQRVCSISQALAPLPSETLPVAVAKRFQHGVKVNYGDFANLQVAVGKPFTIRDPQGQVMALAMLEQGGGEESSLPANAVVRTLQRF